MSGRRRIWSDARGVLHIADTARGAIWKVTIGADVKAAAPTLLVQNPMLEGADGIAFDPRDNLWVAANELNALVMVTASARRSFACSAEHPAGRRAGVGPVA